MIPFWRIELLGGLRARRGDGVVERFRTHKTGALLGILAYERRPHTRLALIEELWPDCGAESGRNNLRLALAALRRTLETAPDERGYFLQADRALVSLLHVETDVAELESLLRTAATAPDPVPALERAIELYRGELLAGFYENWIPMRAARLESLVEAALETLVGGLQSRENIGRALFWANHSAMLPSIAASANWHARIAQLQRAHSSTNKNIELAIPLKPMGAAPIYLTRFFGRETELQQLAAFLDVAQEKTELQTPPKSAPPHWLLTVVGTGGAGKTRLASEALARVDAPTRVWRFVSLAEINDATRLDEALATALAIEVPPARATRACVLEALNETPFLVFDNFEHLLPASAQWLEALKRELPTLRALVTSRQRLNIEGETLLEIAELTLPASESPAEVADCAATALFLNRARAVCPEFSLSERNSANFARLLRRLDGLPLALELAAARVGLLSLEQMLLRLERDADLPPREGGRVPRQRTLNATLGWSLNLLSESERTFLAHLCVWRTPFDAEAARAVAAPHASEIEVLATIARLRDASLLRGARGADEIAGLQRFVILATVCAGARRLLTPAQRQGSERRHALHCVELAEDAEIQTADFGVWNERLSALWPDLSAALNWAVRQQEKGIGLKLASALWWFWPMHGHLDEGIAHLESLLNLNGDNLSGEADLHARAATVLGSLALQAGDYGRAESALQDAIERAHTTKTAAWAFNLRGTSAQRRGDFASACAHFARALELYGPQPTHQRASGLTALAGALVESGQIEQARARCHEARALWRAQHNEPALGWVAEIEGRAALQLGDLTAARAHLEESLSLRQQSANTAAPLGALEALGELELRENHPARARLYGEQSLKLAREAGARPAIAAALRLLGHAAAALGEAEVARISWQHALVLWEEIGDLRHANSCREALK